MKDIKVFDGKKLQLLREERGLTIFELALRAGVSRQAIANWEKEDQKPHGELLQRVVKELETVKGLEHSIDELYISLNRKPVSSNLISVNAEPTTVQNPPLPQPTPHLIPELQTAVSKLPNQDEHIQSKVARLIEVLLS